MTFEELGQQRMREQGLWVFPDPLWFLPTHIHVDFVIYRNYFVVGYVVLSYLLVLVFIRGKPKIHLSYDDKENLVIAFLFSPITIPICLAKGAIEGFFEGVKKLLGL